MRTSLCAVIVVSFSLLQLAVAEPVSFSLHETHAADDLNAKPVVHMLAARAETSEVVAENKHEEAAKANVLAEGETGAKANEEEDMSESHGRGGGRRPSYRVYRRPAYLPAYRPAYRRVYRRPVYRRPVYRPVYRRPIYRQRPVYPVPPPIVYLPPTPPISEPYKPQPPTPEPYKPVAPQVGQDPDEDDEDGDDDDDRDE